MSRSVLFDTETTGFEPLTGDRVIEIAAIELINDLPTGAQYHVLLNPERDIPADSTRVHGITNAHVEGKPLFADIVDEMLAFFGDAPLVAHNAPFDFGFIDHELSRLNRPPSGKRAHDRHAGAGENPLSGHAEQPGRAVPPLRHRSLRPHHT